jgi:hypothetical protein
MGRSKIEREDARTQKYSFVNFGKNNFLRVSGKKKLPKVAKKNGATGGLD